jgi:hypothetical protein
MKIFGVEEVQSQHDRRVAVARLERRRRHGECHERGAAGRLQAHGRAVHAEEVGHLCHRIVFGRAWD